jgi:MFS family permease
MAHLRRDIVLLFSARSLRLFAYGALSVVLALYLHETGLTGAQIGLLFTLTLAGDAGISLWITTTADRLGRKRMLILGAGLMVMAGVVFSLTGNLVLLMIAGIIGVISPSGNEIGPFLSLEQAALSQLLPSEERTRAFAWYNLAGSLATASGALVGGFLSKGLMHFGFSELASYRAVILVYAASGLALAFLFLFLSPNVEAAATAPARERVLGLHASKGIVMKLSGLFAIDAFAGGFVIQSMVSYWFHVKFNLDAGLLGSIFFGANILAGVSALLAARIANRI